MAFKRAYTTEEKIRAVRAWIEEGTFEKAAEKVGVEVEAMKFWQNTDPEWWNQQVCLVCDDLYHERRPGWARLVEAAQKKMLERVEQGDEQVTKDGDIVPFAVRAKDLVTIAEFAATELEKYPGVADSIEGKEARDKRYRDLAEAARQRRDAAQLH